jgi:hypothetical protein
VSRTLRWVALGLALVTAVLLFDHTWSDSGTFAIWALGLPVVLCGASILAAPGPFGGVVTWLAAVAMLAWSLVLGLGIGLYLLPAALVEVAAAASQTRPGYRRA